MKSLFLTTISILTCIFVAVGCHSIEFECVGDGVWLDEESGLCWEKVAIDYDVLFVEAELFCGSMTTNGYHDWRLPTIDEQRTLVVGCPPIEEGGSCGVHDGSSDPDYLYGCDGCGYLEGPNDGYYLRPELDGTCDKGVWTSSRKDGTSRTYWSISFANGSINSRGPMNSGQIRCVRGPEDPPSIPGGDQCSFANALKDIDCGSEVWDGDVCIQNTLDVEQLMGVERIAGNLEIMNSSMVNLDGLDSLKCVDESVNISSNTVLENIDHLVSLAWVGGSVVLYDNPALESLGGLAGLALVDGGLFIGATQGGDEEPLVVLGNDLLADLSGLSSLARVGGLSIVGNAALTGLDGAACLQSIYGDFDIRMTPAVETISLPRLRAVRSRLHFLDNDALPDCEACELLDQLTLGPDYINVYDNFGDNLGHVCSPVPENCP